MLPCSSPIPATFKREKCVRAFEEVPGLGKSVLVLRAKTERPEGVIAGTVKLVGTDQAKIVKEAARLLDDDNVYAKMAQTVNPYGDGRAAERIAKLLPQLSAFEVIAGLREFQNLNPPKT